MTVTVTGCTLWRNSESCKQVQREFSAISKTAHTLRSETRTWITCVVTVRFPQFVRVCVCVCACVCASVRVSALCLASVRVSVTVFFFFLNPMFENTFEKHVWIWLWKWVRKQLWNVPHRWFELWWKQCLNLQKTRLKHSDSLTFEVKFETASLFSLWLFN